MKYIFLLGLFASLSSHGIVIRHDKVDSQYLTTIESFPPLATFYIDGAHGTLIDSRWVVTAAHASFCIEPNRFVLIGNKPQLIKNVFVNSNYTPGKSHDIALVELAQPVLDVVPAQRYKMADELGKDIWFIGIGGTGNGLTGQTIDNAKNRGVLRLAQNKISSANGPLLEFVFDQGKTALPLEGVSGGGDSGGPAFLITDNGFKLFGVSSRFIGGSTGKYGITEIYSRISYFNDWIDQIIHGTAEQRSLISTNKLKHLPGGLTNDNLPMICEQITLARDTVGIVNP